MFENVNLLPKVAPPVEVEKNIWSFDNPNLVSDVTDWALETPNIYYVGLGVLVVAIALVACICCCCQCCCRCCFSQKSARIVTEAPKEEIERIESAKKHIKVRDVLND